MAMITAERMGCMLLALLGAAGLWQSGQLEMWTFQGPGAGLFPRAAAIALVVLAVLCMVLPRTGSVAGMADAADAADAVVSFAQAAPQERRTGVLYAVALASLVPGVAWAGFWLTAFLLVSFLMRIAEGRSWRASLGFGAIVATAGLGLFGVLLRVSLPVGPLDRWLTALMRSAGG
jgi:hypothetical protein